ncbi:MAG: diaminopimelate epimerase [Synergistaceae bacterium]|nr:diaminopimelate epimerase [Synergistaceae bacterium]
MIPFTKMQGNGNDFIVLDNRSGRFSGEDLARAAGLYCRRRQSLGADGILVVEASREADYVMRLFNADGSEGEMCGNGARCIAKYAFEKGIAGRRQKFSTLAGIITAEVDPPFVNLDMGTVRLDEGWFGRTVEAAGEVFEASFIWVGVPHAVLFPRAELPRERKILIGRELRHNLSLFPEGANVNFVMPDEDGRIRSVTYERGVEDLTDSCGTGSTASAICHVLKGSVSKEVPVVVDVINPGGINAVTLVFDGEGKSAAASLRGRTVIVAEGFLTEEL